MQIIPREAWGAAHEDGYGSSTLPAAEVWLHHSVTVAPDLVPPFDDDDQAVRALERIGEQRFGRGISYTFLVTPSGRVYEGHSVEREGAHTAGRNDAARAICWVGNYDTTEPTPAMIEATAQLLVDGKAAGWWRAARLNGGHRDAPGARTACPGRHGHSAIERVNAATAGVKAAAAPPPPPPPAAPPALPARPGWAIPGGHWLGHIKGPAASHGGFYEHEQPMVRYAQLAFIAAGCVPGVQLGSVRADRWADGRWENPTTEACRRWFARTRPGQPFTTRIYRDDWEWLGR